MSWGNLPKAAGSNENEKPKEFTKSDENNKNSLSFENLKEVRQKRGLKILSYGNFSTGKTHFALSSPGPVYIIDTENGASPLADKFPEAKVVTIANQDSKEVDEKDEVKNFENFLEAVDLLMKKDDVGTIVIDSISDIWEWAQAYGKVKIFKIRVEDRLKQQWDWSIINRLYSKPLRNLINKNCNLILTARESEVYEAAGKPTGKFDPKCQKKTPYWVDIVMHHQQRYINKEIKFYGRINKCRQNGKITNKMIENPNVNKIKELVENKEGAEK